MQAFVLVTFLSLAPAQAAQAALITPAEAVTGETAIDAVKQWIYTPTLLNGVPVPVIMTVTVNFRLS
jgi:periplasmic protein TonB